MGSISGAGRVTLPPIARGRDGFLDTAAGKVTVGLGVTALAGGLTFGIARLLGRSTGAAARAAGLLGALAGVALLASACGGSSRPARPSNPSGGTRPQQPPVTVPTPGSGGTSPGDDGPGHVPPGVPVDPPVHVPPVDPGNTSPGDDGPGHAPPGVPIDPPTNPGGTSPGDDDPGYEPPVSPGDDGPGYTWPSYDVNCPDISRDFAQWLLDQDPSDPFRLDADHDGIACEGNRY